MIGANDLGTSVDRYEADECGGPDNLACFKEQIDVTEANITELLARIHAVTRGHKVALPVMDYWNFDNDGDAALSTPAGERADMLTVNAELNAAICTAAVATDALCLHTTPVFKGADGTGDPTPYLQQDGWE